MKQGSEHDKKAFDAQYKKLEGIKEELKHSHSLDILQGIITRYNSVYVASEEVIRHNKANQKALKKLSKLESRIDQLVFDALYKELETMKHELKHCTGLEQLDTLSQHHKKISTNEDSVFRHITKHSSAQEKILKLEKKIVDQLHGKKKEFTGVHFELSSDIPDTKNATDNSKPVEPEQQSEINDVLVDKVHAEAIDFVVQQTNVSSEQDVLISDDSVHLTPSTIDIPDTKKTGEEHNTSIEDSANNQSVLLQQKKMRESQLAQFDKIVKKLASKRDDFHLRYPKDSCYDMTKAYGATYQLVKNLSGFSESYKEGIMPLNVFKAQTTQAIQRQRQGVLSEHRGCKELLANLLLAIGTLGIGYALAALYTQSFMPIKLNTQSVHCMEQALKSVEQCDSTIKNGF